MVTKKTKDIRIRKIQNRKRIEYRKRIEIDSSGKSTRVSIKEEVTKRFTEEMRWTGPRVCFNCAEKYKEIKIEKLLKKIRRKPYENVILVAFNGQKIIDSIVFSGEKDTINIKDYFDSKAVLKMKEWAKLGLDICNYHNHPDQIAARPSYEDLCSFAPSVVKNNKNVEMWKNYEDSYNIHLPCDFKYADWGIITEVDFFSAIQSESRIVQLCQEEKQRLEDNKYKSPGSALDYLMKCGNVEQ